MRSTSASRRLAGNTASWVIAITTLLGGASVAMAQEDATAQDDAIVLDTIIVGGEKFARDPFTTYTSVEVVTSEELDAHVRKTLGQALNSAPNIRAFETGDGNTNIVIRGNNAEGATQPSRSNPVISVTVDGAEQGIEATRRGTRGIWDVEQIEVLRGPQSTLQGRNALAGAVVIKTKDPTWEPEFIVEGLADTDDMKSGAFALSAPIFKDQLAFRLSGQVFRDKKDITYVDPALASLGEDEFEEFRGKLLFTPDFLPGFTGLFTVSHTHDKPAWALVTGPDYFDRVFDDVAMSAAEFRDTKVNRYTADLTYELTPDWTAKSVTSFVDTKVDITSPASSILVRDDIRDGGDFSQDLRFTYDSPDSPFSGVFGVYAGRSTMGINSNIDVQNFALVGMLIEQGADPVDASNLVAFLSGGGTRTPYQRLDAENKSESIAAYADVRYDFADRWTLLAGGRLLYDKVSSNYAGQLLDVTDFTDFAASMDEKSSIANTAFLPKIGLAFKLTEDQTLAATVSRGYRPGFSELVIGSTAINEVEAESVWSYELAYRSRWLDERLHLSANVFYNDYRNQQIPVAFDFRFPFHTITVNAARSHSYGAEIEARWNASPNLELFAGLGLLKTRFDEGVDEAGNSLEGNSFTEAPAVTASLGAIWRHESGFFAGADVSYTDGYYSKGNISNTPALSVDPFTLVNAQIGYETENLTFTAFAKNLFDEQYLTSISSGGTYATIGDGRSFGIQVTGRF